MSDSTQPDTSLPEALPDEKFWVRIIMITSIAISAAVAFLILGPRPEGLAQGLDVSILPHVNAALNTLTTALLILALFFIKAGNIPRHKTTMLGAFGTSTLFLVTYVVYHWFKAGPKPYLGEFVTLYRFVLISHIVLAAVILPAILLTLYRGWNMQVEKHRKLARIAFPAWLYVSITGVAVYAMLY